MEVEFKKVVINCFESSLNQLKEMMLSISLKKVHKHILILCN